MEKMKERVLNANFIVAVVMFISLFLTFFNNWASAIYHDSLFDVAKEHSLMWILIICVIAIILISILVSEVKKRSSYIGYISTLIIIVNIISVIMLVVRGDYKSIAIGWTVLTVTSVIQIIISVKNNKETVKKVIDHKISKI